MTEAGENFPGAGTSQGVASVRRSIAALLLVLALAALLTPRIWREEKSFDDVAAIGNACHLWATGFDTEQLFFRSRHRPSFVFFALPVCAVFEHDLAEQDYSYTDFRQRLYSFYERHGARTFPEITIWTLVFVAALLLGSSWTFRRLVPDALFGAAMVFGVAIALRPHLEGAAVTLAFVFATHLLSLFAFVLFLQRRTCPRLVFAALCVAFGFLAKLDHTVTITALAVLQAYLLVKPERASQRRELFGAFSAFWALAAMPVLVWHYGVLGGFFTEVRAFAREQADVQWLMGYAPVTPANIWNGLWEAAGWLLPLGAAGIAAETLHYLRGRQRFTEGYWLSAGYVLGHWGLLSLTYVFPRFFIYLLLPLSWFVCVPLWRLVYEGPGRRLPERWRPIAFAALVVAVFNLSQRVPVPTLPDPPPDNALSERFQSPEWRDRFEIRGDLGVERTPEGLAIPIEPGRAAFLRRTLYAGQRYGRVRVVLAADIRGAPAPVLRVVSRLSQTIVAAYVGPERLSLRRFGGRWVHVPVEPGDAVELEVVSLPSGATELRVNGEPHATLEALFAVAHIDIGAFEAPPADASGTLLAREVSFDPAAEEVVSSDFFRQP